MNYEEKQPCAKQERKTIGSLYEYHEKLNEETTQAILMLEEKVRALVGEISPVEKNKSTEPSTFIAAYDLQIQKVRVNLELLRAIYEALSQGF